MSLMAELGVEAPQKAAVAASQPAQVKAEVTSELPAAIQQPPPEPVSIRLYYILLMAH